MFKNQYGKTVVVFKLSLHYIAGDVMAGKVEAYCVKCKQKREMKDAEEVTMANGKKARKGTCPTCGTKMFKIGG